MPFPALDIEPINASQQSLVRIFGDEYAFSIPPYQRPYAWEETQARELLDDIEVALKEAQTSRDPITYFLGSVVLIKKPGAPDAKIVDGQQRLTTLTILLAVLRDLSDGKNIQKRQFYICEEGDTDKGTKDRYRLIPRKQDAQFFQENIQKQEATAKLDGNEGETESQKRIVLNAVLFRKALQQKPSEERDDLIAFLLQRCYLVVIAVTNVETAHRVFTVLNARGLDLTPTDILKADLLDRVSKSNEEPFARLWEDFETALSRDRFVDLFHHIRMINQKEKPRERLEVGFPKFVREFKKEPEQFLKNTLARHAKTYVAILTPDDAIRRYGPDARDIIGYLLQLDNSDWQPIAIDYLSREKLSQPAAKVFLERLERLAYYMFVTRANINERISRYAKAIAQLQKGTKVDDPNCALSLSKLEELEFLDELDGPIYEKTRVRLPVLLRLDAAFSDGGAKYHQGVISVEHVMPQSPRAGSPWLKMFADDEQRHEWTHCLGNLVLLTRAKNSQASNWEFDRKKSEYFSDRSGISSFRITTQVIKEKKWDRKALERRHWKLMEKLSSVWDLDFTSWHEKLEREQAS